MKIRTLFSALCVLIIVSASGWAGTEKNQEKINESREKINVSMDSLLNYYSEMARLEAKSETPAKAVPCFRLQAFVSSSRDEIASVLEKIPGCHEISRAHNIIKRLYLGREKQEVQGHGYHSLKVEAVAPMYVDLITKHKYVRNADNTYSEFTRKGEFFKKISPDQPHLAQNRYVVPVPENCYLCYSKNKYLENTASMVLKSSQSHPEGWYLENVLVSLD
ncbi:MAG: hypothetical protein R6U68_05805 [Desulfobacteraceae bacterium]